MEEEQQIEIQKNTILDTIKRYKRIIIPGIGMLVILIGLIFSLYLLQKPQESRSHAGVGSSIMLTATPASFDAKLGKDQIVELSIDSQGNDLIGADIIISYPDNFVTISKFEASTRFGKQVSQTTQLTPGIYRITYVTIEQGKASRGVVPLGKFTFKTNKPGLAALSLVNSQVVTPQGEIPVDSAIRKIVVKPLTPIKTTNNSQLITIINKCLNKASLCSYQEKKQADVNKDGYVDKNDLIKAQQSDL